MAVAFRGSVCTACALHRSATGATSVFTRTSRFAVRPCAPLAVSTEPLEPQEMSQRTSPPGHLPASKVQVTSSLIEADCGARRAGEAIGGSQAPSGVGLGVSASEVVSAVRAQPVPVTPTREANSSALAPTSSSAQAPLQAPPSASSTSTSSSSAAGRRNNKSAQGIWFTRA